MTEPAVQPLSDEDIRCHLHALVNLAFDLGQHDMQCRAGMTCATCDRKGAAVDSKVQSILQSFRTALDQARAELEEARKKIGEWRTGCHYGEAALNWISERVREGRGTVQFGATVDGDIGVWIGVADGDENAPSLGRGDEAYDAIIAAIVKESGDQIAALTTTREE